jgi:hypothetical protein
MHVTIRTLSTDETKGLNILNISTEMANYDMK